jgi:protein tyrosine/serine phosphatase
MEKSEQNVKKKFCGVRDKNTDNKIIKSKKVLNFYKLSGTESKVCCHGKPTENDIIVMKNIHGVNCVLSLLHESENAEQIGKFCKKQEITWIHLKLAGANMAVFNNKVTQNAIVETLLMLYNNLLNGNITLFVHCAAGLHRTGTILYCILRMFQESAESTLNAIELIRKETRDKVGKDRIEYAEKILVPVLLEKMNK